MSLFLFSFFLGGGAGLFTATQGKILIPWNQCLISRKWEVESKFCWGQCPSWHHVISQCDKISCNLQGIVTKCCGDKTLWQIFCIHAEAPFFMLCEDSSLFCSIYASEKQFPLFFNKPKDVFITTFKIRLKSSTAGSLTAHQQQKQWKKCNKEVRRPGREMDGGYQKCLRHPQADICTGQWEVG